MNNLLALITAFATCTACINWNDEQLAEIAATTGQVQSPVVLTAISGILRSVASTNAAASYLGGNPSVIKIEQCSDAMLLTRDTMVWPEGWGIVQDPEKPNYPGMLNCYITDGVQYAPLTVAKTV
jgi:hypothetical protein